DESRRYAESIADLERHVPALIVSALTELSGPVVPGARLLSESQMAQSPPERRRWILRLIAILEEEGLARRSGGGMCWAARPRPRGGGGGGCGAGTDTGLHGVGKRALARRVGDRRGALISGGAAPLEMLFRGGGDARVPPFSRPAPPLRALNAAVAEMVARLA